MVNIIIQRYGRRQSELDRGGIWATIIHNEIKSSYDTIYKKLHRYSGQYHYGLIDVLKPFFVDVTNLKENYYPLVLYGLLTGVHRKDINEYADDFYREIGRECDKKSYEPYEDCMEHKYAEIEKACSFILKRKGYDGVIFVDKDVFTQVFYVGSPLYIRWFE